MMICTMLYPPDHRIQKQLRQHQCALHLPRLTEPPTHDLTYTRSARAPTSPRIDGFCVIWDCTRTSSRILDILGV